MVGEEQRVERVERHGLAERLDGDDPGTEPAGDPPRRRGRVSASAEAVLHAVILGE
ncbi:hypothetical protein GCM10023203_19120 [Actinomycetospora straminea]|uniref:Uncharacterized protein n=1 Tax=Actinomycetospora straminea TaxID=663607 RepID=A0ABP9E5T6_9PSEU